MDGTVQRRGSRVRALIQMTEVETGNAIWAEKADEDDDDLFALQDAIVEQVTTSLGIALLGDTAGFRMVEVFSSGKARDLYFRSLSRMYKFTALESQMARDCLEGILRLYPDAELAPGMIWLYHWFDGAFGWSPDKARSDQEVWDWAQRAVSAGDISGFGNTVAGNLALFQECRAAAKEYANRAVTSQSSCPLCYGQLGQIQSYFGDPNSAIKTTRYALHLERVFPPWTVHVLAATYRDPGVLDRLSEALEAAGLPA